MEEEIKPVVTVTEEEEKPKVKRFTNAALQKQLTSLSGTVGMLTAKVNKLEKRVQEIQPAATEPPGSGQPHERAKTINEDSDIIKAVHDILGEGFRVSTEPVGDAINYKLVIVPPEHLKESKEDTRIKIIPYMEGLGGAENYAGKVKKFCIAWAHREGVNYEK